MLGRLRTLVVESRRSGKAGLPKGLGFECSRGSAIFRAGRSVQEKVEPQTSTLP
jgi:hypothetical protein